MKPTISRALYFAQLELIRAGQTPQQAIRQALREFNADTLAGLEQALSAVLDAVDEVQQEMGIQADEVML